MANELLRPNQYDIFAKSVTCESIETTGAPTTYEISGACLATTINGATSASGTGPNTVVLEGLVIKYRVSNGICTLYKRGDSSAFPSAYNANLAATNRLFLLLKKSGTPSGQGAVYFPADTFPICDAENSDGCFRGTVNFVTALKQSASGSSSTGSQTIVTTFNFCTTNVNGQYGSITIPRTNDYILYNDISGIVTGETTISSTPQTAPLDSGTLIPTDLTYTVQNFGAEIDESSFPFFSIEYPVLG